MLSGAGFAGFNHPGKLEGVFQGREQKWFAEQTAKTSLDRFRGGQDSAAGNVQPGRTADFGERDCIAVGISGAGGDRRRIRLPGIGAGDREWIAEEHRWTVRHDEIVRLHLV